jgi:hypothetical protein
MYKKILSALVMCFALSSVYGHDECIWSPLKPDFINLMNKCVKHHQNKSYGLIPQINEDFKNLIQQYAKPSDEGDHPSKCTQFFQDLYDAVVKYDYKFCISRDNADFVKILTRYQPFTVNIDPSDYVRARMINDIVNLQAYWAQCTERQYPQSDCSTRLCHLMTDGRNCD